MLGFYAIFGIPIVEQSVIDEFSVQSLGLELGGAVNEHWSSKIIKIRNVREVSLIMAGCL